MSLIIKLLITAIVSYILQRLLDGVHFVDFGTAIIFAIVLGILNIILKPILHFFSLPITIFTFGLFSLVINAVVVIIAGRFVEGVEIDGFIWALIFSLLLSVITSIVSFFAED